MTTVHLVYPHGDRISCPDAIGRKVGERLSREYRVLRYDWTEARTIEPGDDDVLVGHPHPAPWTVFRRSVRRPGWRRRLVLAPYNHVPGQVAFADRSVRASDLYLAITGRYWYQTVPESLFSHWYPKMVHVDLAVDRIDFPPIKREFNPRERRRFLYVGHASPTKNVEYLGRIARAMPGVTFSWIGLGEPVSGLHRLGEQDFRATSARSLIADHDFLLSPSRADASPATVLEAMAWGLVPVCTSQSGYAEPGIVNMPLDDVAGAVEVLRRLQGAPVAELRSHQDANWAILDQHFNWDRFTAQIRDAIESVVSPPSGHVSPSKRIELVVASVLDRRAASFRVLALPHLLYAAPSNHSRSRGVADE